MIPEHACNPGHSPAWLRRGALLIATALVLVASCPNVGAQARAGDDAAVAPSPFAAAFVRFEDALAPRLFGADDAASRWLSGRLSGLEPAARARDYASAVARDPGELLYVASLAETCMDATVALSDCGERDIVGHWASRDADNAVPWLLQAERARRRSNTGSLIENLDRASRSQRYDNYEPRAGAAVWRKLAPLAASADRAAVVVYASAPAGGGARMQALEALCAAPSGGGDERIGSACLRLGSLMAQRAALFVDRRAGTQITLGATQPAASRAGAAELARTVVAQQDRCRATLDSLERLANGTPVQRDRAVALGEAWLADRARNGEPAACESLTRALSNSDAKGVR